MLVFKFLGPISPYCTAVDKCTQEQVAAVITAKGRIAAAAYRPTEVQISHIAYDRLQRKMSSQNCPFAWGDPSPHPTHDFLSAAESISRTIRYDTRCYFNVRSKADMSQLNLPHGTDN